MIRSSLVWISISWIILATLLIILICIGFTTLPFLSTKLNSSSESQRSPILISSSSHQILSCVQDNVEVLNFTSFASEKNAPLLSQNDPRLLPSTDSPSKNQHLLAVIIPYRNRWNQMLVLNLLLGKFLRNQGIQYRMFAINQTDSFRFNRGALMNVGVHIAMKFGCDYVALQDVDLIPAHHSLSYDYPKQEGVYHVSPNDLYLQYSRAPDFFGGISVMRVSSYLKMDGFSNLFWGWGKEDEEFLRRLNSNLSANFTRQRPPRRNESAASENEIYFYHFHGDEVPRDKRSLSYGVPNAQFSGFHDLEYKCKRMYVLDEKELSVKDLVVVDVELPCNMTRSPNCDEEYVKELMEKERKEKEEKMKAS
mmetsp:Transcript_12724/g.22886  ORF Transcript_12724/g.22886 Transcript_12724/m.22886 type:complete len:366 (-) Transcript_12724:500-1597(-)|eukprot:CAMPEP_0182442922 /NCGR_PEP_ID=MMETSP1172-20130603/1778_1 /TAXON_ID=708627 /ORGANISM="Timspurckia oligopyrenoides, Strain CCMP3278" /LENGTH=365 /DNA_ID=CAMNT_0024638011 /DNA_START=129 /DNA_END=1226 /DNA_ORIENTATION=-